MTRPQPGDRPAFFRDRLVLIAIASAVLAVAFSGGFWAGARRAEAQPTRQAKVRTLPGLVSDFAPATVVATIDGRELTLGALMVRYATAPAAQRQRYASNGRGLRGFLDDTVANLAVAAEARAMGAEQEPLYEVLLEIRREDVLRDLYARRTVLAQIDEPSLRARYEEQKASRFEREPRIRLRHILVTPVREATPPNTSGDDAVGRQAALKKARRLRRKLAAGADFADLARRFSEDASAPDGGDIGWASPEELLPELARAAFALAPGELSEVIETPLGFHLVEVLELRRGGTVPYELVRELIYQEMVGEQAPYFARLAQEDREARLAEREVVTYPERLPW